jgi:hypothetical protein
MENSVCREIHLLPNHSISEMFYKCGWMHKEYEGTAISLEYEACDPRFKEIRKYVFQIPLLEHMGKKVYTSKLFVS